MKFINVELPYNFENFPTQALSNDLFILNQNFFVKRSKPITKAFLNWNNQLKVIALVQNQPFTLPILEAQIAEDKLWILMPYYQNLTTLANTKITNEILKELANLVQQLHGLAIDPANNIIKWEPVAQLNRYCNLVTTNNPQLNAIKAELISFLQSYQPEKNVLAHNDLVSNNFVCHQEKWYLIDWDFAMINDRLFDVASLASETLKTPEASNYWFQLFKLTKAELTIVKFWIKYQNLIWYHWAIFLYQKTKNNTYQTIAEEKLKSLLT